MEVWAEELINFPVPALHCQVTPFLQKKYPFLPCSIHFRSAELSEMI